ncbi:MAG: protein-export protein SecB [Pelagibacterales bacterium MED-G42]|nr:MAG: protein-export protein SecB [Pelagibacterales bacterium MED-G42]
MTEKFKILTSYIKDLSSETPNVETFIFVQENINKYQLNIDINSKALKNKMIEVNTTLKFEDKEPNEKKSYYEIVYSTVVSLNDDVRNDKNELQKIILCDVPTAIYPNLEKAFLNLMHDSGHPNLKLDKKIDFNKLYNDRFN